jgi:Skp family chaperone for outer membrane proteins
MAMKGSVLAAAVALVLAGVPSYAQTPPAQQPPAQQPPAPKPAAPTTQQPPAQPAAKPAAPAPAPPAAPRPFPEGAKIAYVVLQRIVNESAEGKAASGQIQALQQKKATELNDKNKQLQTIQQRLEKEGSVMNATTQADLTKQAEKLNVEIQRFTQDAQQEIQDLQNQLQSQFQQKIDPIIAQIGAEKGLHFIFNGPDSGLVWADTGLDISADVIKKLDAGFKPAK